MAREVTEASTPDAEAEDSSEAAGAEEAVSLKICSKAEAASKGGMHRAIKEGDEGK